MNGGGAGRRRRRCSRRTIRFVLSFSFPLSRPRPRLISGGLFLPAFCLHVPLVPAEIASLVGLGRLRRRGLALVVAVEPDSVTVYGPGSFISFTRFIITLITRYFPLYHYSASCVQPQTPLPFPVLTSLRQQLPGYVFNHVIFPYAYVSTTWHLPF